MHSAVVENEPFPPKGCRVQVNKSSTMKLQTQTSGGRSKVVENETHLSKAEHKQANHSQETNKTQTSHKMQYPNVLL